MDFNLINRHIYDLHPRARLQIAESYRKFADQLERVARQDIKEQESRILWRHYLNVLHGVPDAVQSEIDNGKDKDEAIRSVASDRNVSFEHIKGMMTLWAKRDRRAELERRELKIMEYKRQGFNNAEISRMPDIDISRSQVSRVVKKYLYRYE